ncbi:MAG: response regulator [Burkholderiaceae bacterium]|nr:response regulator [Burkholderiaceae bacterium]
MTAPVRIAILGFSDFERSALASQLERAWRRERSYRHVLAIDDADLIIADADQPGVLALLQRIDRVDDAVFVGAQTPGAGAGWMMRPIDPARVLRQLDSLQLRRSAEPPPDSQLPTQPDVFRDLFHDGPPTAPAPLTPLGERTLPGALRTIGSVGTIEALALGGRRDYDRPPLAETRQDREQQRERAALARLARDRAAIEERRRRRLEALRPRLPPRALLVDDSEVALHFLRRVLAPYGLACDCARDSDRAQDLLARQAYGIVFMDVDLGPDSPLDGLDLCHRIRHHGLHPGGEAPAVVLVSVQHGAVDRVRGTLAGAEAFLGKPLDRQALDAVLQGLGFVSAVPLGLGGSPDGPQPAA